MSNTLPDPELRQILKDSKSIVVVGLSPVPARPSHGVTRYLIENGYDIYGVRPGAPHEILGRPSYDSLDELPHDLVPDIIDVFRNPNAIPAVVDALEQWMISHGKTPKLLWLQEGVTHQEAEEKAARLGVKVVSDLCILKEHARLL
jgi:uncharacterized protein